MSLFVKKLDPRAILPRKNNNDDAGYDLAALTDVVIPPAMLHGSGGYFTPVEIGRVLIPTGLAMSIPKGSYGRIAPRSGLSLKGLDIGAGVCDCTYRGQISVLMFNFSAKEFKVSAGDRIAQLIIEKIVETDIIEVDDLDTTTRGENGFGSSGIITSV